MAGLTIVIGLLFCALVGFVVHDADLIMSRDLKQTDVNVSIKLIELYSQLDTSFKRLLLAPCCENNFQSVLRVFKR